MTTLYTFSSALVNLAAANARWVTREQRERLTNRAERNTEAALRFEPDFIHFSEGFDRFTRRGVFAALGGDYEVIKRLGNSAILAIKRSEWEVEESGHVLLHGIVWRGLPFRSRIVSSRRWMAWALVRNRKTGRLMVVGADHLAPPGTAQGETAIRNSAAAHEDARRAENDFADKRRSRVILIGGDKNTEQTILRDARSIGQGKAHGIDRLEARDGVNAEVRGLVAEDYALPASDHRLIVVRGRVVRRG